MRYRPTSPQHAVVVAWPALALFAPAAIAQDDDDGAVVQQTTSLPPSTKLAPEQTTTPERTPAQGAIPGQYIVVLKEEVRDPTAVAREHARRHGAQVLHIYQHALKGYAARIPDQRLEEVLAEERIDYIERDGKVTTVAQMLPWGIDRINADRSSTRAGNGTEDLTHNTTAQIGLYAHLCQGGRS